MDNLRSVLLFLFLALLFAFTVQAQESDWRFWQEQFNRMQTEKGSAPDNPSLRIKDIEVTATLKDNPEIQVSSYRNQFYEKCTTCHDGKCGGCRGESFLKHFFLLLKSSKRGFPL